MFLQRKNKPEFPRITYAAFVACLFLCGMTAYAQPPAPPNAYFQIQVVDDKTNRGVPLVELETVNHLRYVTDSAGRVAFYEPALMGQSIFFFVRSHGYEYPKDGFGNAGLALTTTAGKQSTIRIKRINIAERLYRLTGEGIYLDTFLLGETAPIAEPLCSGLVVGQDTAMAIPYRGMLYWFWGDTNRMKYPLGHFWTSGATAQAPGSGGLDPAQGVNLRYFTSSDGFSRPVCRLGVKSGPIWIDGLVTVPGEGGGERLITHYAHMESLSKILDHGLAIWNDEKQEFERLKELDLNDKWRQPRAHPIRRTENGAVYYYIGEPFPNTRVKAELKQITDPAAYEAWTCLAKDVLTGLEKIQRGADGRLRYEWRTNSRPLTPAEERKLIESKQIKPDEAYYQPVDAEKGKPIQMHNGSVNWNEYRKRWIMIASQHGGTSFLGEVWYSEAPEATGPWRRAVKIVTHNNYTFYNPVHRPFFDQEGGRLIYFEGTYAETFSGNKFPTPRYDYNQIMYRLDLSDPRLKTVGQD
ncbi:MAG: hypothetical protein NTX50_14825 [Candidatus Sumerlaeota bacterium]|nr:hypothetical protein [Candidatus Sumerlaeota bacterium]